MVNRLQIKETLTSLYNSGVLYSLPLLIFLMVAATTLLFWGSSWRYIEKNEQNQNKMASVTLSDIVNEEIAFHNKELFRMASRWKARQGGTPYDEWYQDALNHFREQPGYQAIEWVDSKYYVRWVAPLKPNEAALNFNLASEGLPFQAVRKAIDKDICTMSPIVTLKTGNKGFLLYSPIIIDQKFKGLLVGVIDARSFFKEIFRDAVPEYNIEIHAGNELLYQRNPNQDIKSRHNSMTITSKNFGWSITSWARPQLLGIQHSWLPIVILFIGFIIALMLALISHLAQIAKRNADKAIEEIRIREKTEKQLILYSRKLKKLSLVDHLTGVANRRSLSHTLQDELSHLKGTDTSLSVLLIDIDHFKDINDTYGHVTGDLVLQKVGTILRKNTRLSDTVARYGGEEFCIILRDTTDRQAYAVAEKLRLVISKQTFKSDKKASLHVTCSFGVYQIPSKIKKITEIFEVVDGALYTAKNSGRNCVVLV